MTLFRDVANWHKSYSNGKRAMKQWIDKLRQERTLTPEEFRQLLTGCDAEILRYINKQAQEVALLHFGNKIYIRGLIEISNCCRNNCYYCGIRKGNLNIERYRLSRESILNCCKQGYELGFRTFCITRRRRSCTNKRSDRNDCCPYQTGVSGLCYYAVTR